MLGHASLQWLFKVTNVQIYTFFTPPHYSAYAWVFCPEGVPSMSHLCAVRFKMNWDVFHVSAMCGMAMLLGCFSVASLSGLFLFIFDFVDLSKALRLFSTFTAIPLPVLSLVLHCHGNLIQIFTGNSAASTLVCNVYLFFHVAKSSFSSILPLD